MANNVVVHFEADYTALKPAIDYLEKIKVLDKETADQFRTNNASFVKGQEQVQGSLKNTHAGISQLSESFKQLGAGLAAGFGIEKIIEFGKESVKAFAEAEKGAQQLLFALNNNKAAQERLIAVAKLQGKALAIEPDVIVKQQALLALQGLNEKQIQKTTYAAAQLAAKMGTDLGTAVNTLSATFEGNIGRLGKLDDRFKTLSKTQLENGAAVDLVVEKYKGFAESTLGTTAGKMQQFQVQIEEFKQVIGESLVTGLFPLLKESVYGVLKPLQEFAESVKDIGQELGVASTETSFLADLIKGSLTLALLPIKLLAKGVSLIADAFKEAVAVAGGFGSAINVLFENIKNGSFTNLGEKISYGFNKGYDAIKEKTKEVAEVVARDTDDILAKQGEAQIGLLQRAKDKLKELQEALDSAPTVAAAKKIVAQIKEQQKIIDDLTGKTADENAKELEKKKADTARFFSEMLGLLKKSGDAVKEKLEKEGIAEAKALDESIVKKMEADAKIKKLDDALLQAKLDNIEKERKKREDAAEANSETVKGIVLDSQQAIADIAFDSLKENIAREQDEKISSLEKQKEHELQNKRLTNSQRKAIEEKYAKEEAKIKLDAAKKIRKAEVNQAEINGLLAITAILADSSVPSLEKPFLIAAAVIKSALTVAAIESKPLPAFAKGKERVEGPGTSTSDSIVARISKGERVVDAETNEDYFPILSAIHNRKISPSLLNAMVLPNFSATDISGMLSITSGMSIDYDKLGYYFAKHQEELFEKRDHKNRNAGKHLVDTIEKLVIKSQETDPRRR